ncbi:hypothetical protein [Bacillus sp. FJAT-22090]|uniref:hypothetical protein n=1 Tax=Bacillus sp. FJAT-22090 TaxID=1581038 RepID=UPI0011A89614|nr:hypothetical protein [Bacillus sp. FJAT-22090]
MKKLLLFIGGCVLLAACSEDESFNGYEVQLEEKNLKLVDQLKEKEQKVDELNQHIEQLNVQIEDFNMEKEHFVFVSNISREFVEAHTIGDKDKLHQLISEDIVLIEKEGKLNASMNNSDGYEWNLFNKEAKRKFVDWVIQGYEYDGETETFNIAIREFYLDSNGEPESPPTFLYLTFKMYNNEWKINSLAFDV